MSCLLSTSIAPCFEPVIHHAEVVTNLGTLGMYVVATLFLVAILRFFIVPLFTPLYGMVSSRVVTIVCD